MMTILIEQGNPAKVWVDPGCLARLGRPIDIGAQAVESLSEALAPADGCAASPAPPAGNVPAHGTFALLAADGSAIPVVTHTQQMVDLDGGGTCSIVTIAERTGTAGAEDAVSSSDERQLALGDSPEAVVGRTDLDGRWTLLTSGWQRLTGFPVGESLGRSLLDFVHHGDHERVSSAFSDLVHGRQQAILLERVRINTKDGNVRAIELRQQLVTAAGGGPVAATVTLEDLSARQRIELEVRHAQKLESVGRLAAGIAHEINTPIQFLGDNLRFLEDAFLTVLRLLGSYRDALTGDGKQLPWEERKAALSLAEANADVAYLEQEVPQAVGQALDGVERVASIVRAMKAFGHPDGAEPQWTDLNQALRDTLIVARNEYKYIADVEEDLGDLPPVLCHPGDLKQVFLNLLVNAAHAVADAVDSREPDDPERGRITVASRSIDGQVEFSITDTGTGIRDDVQPRVFDPFFTTKEPGRGTGQGLALARAVVCDKHGGAIEFATEPGRGTTFTVRLPEAGRRTSGGSE